MGVIVRFFSQDDAEAVTVAKAGIAQREKHELFWRVCVNGELQDGSFCFEAKEGALKNTLK